jgi:threonine dehydratase
LTSSSFPSAAAGLIAGVGRATKSLRPEAKIIGVEPVNAPTLDASLKAGCVTRIETKPTLADGLAVAEIGKLCFEVAREVMDQLLLVDEAQIAQAVLRLLELEKTVVEGGGAVPLAAAMNPDVDLTNKKVVLILSGGNIDVTVISKIIERGLGRRRSALSHHLPRQRPPGLAGAPDDDPRGDRGERKRSRP